MKKKISIDQLIHGMYISELDRPWIETSFMFQGFLIESDSQLEEITKQCEYVYIDTEEGIDVPVGQKAPSAGTSRSIETEEEEEDSILGRNFKAAIVAEEEKAPPPKQDLLTVEAEMGAAKEAEQNTRRIIYSILDDAKLGRSVSAEGAREAVAELTQSIIRNPDALVVLSQLKDKDEYTALHSMRVCILALAFGRHLGYDEDQLNILGMGALLHDVGKMKVPQELLNKPGKLSSKEFDLVKQHVPEGVKILENSKGIPELAIDVARYHHERFNGEGYASGKKASEISEFGLIGGIVDCYDAITSDRAYHDAMTTHDALRKMYEWRTKDFHPKLVEQFIQCMGIYPIGSVVEMNNGTVGVVVTINRQRRLKPKIVLVLSPDKKPLVPIKIVDLMKASTMGGTTLEVKKVLPSGSFGISPTEFLPVHAA